MLRFGVALDIDGVLIRGKNRLPWTTSVLRTLKERSIPHIFLTNGGGASEPQCAERFTGLFGENVDPGRLVLGHSAFRELVPLYHDKPVLVIGKDSCKDAALYCGFKKPMLTSEFLALNASRWPLSVPASVAPMPLQEPIAAILAFHDSWDWGRDAQIVLDVLRGADGSPGAIDAKHGANPTMATRKSSIPFYCASSDRHWQNEHPLPRLAQGVLPFIISKLHKEQTGEDLNVTFFGKPQPRQYDYARSVLARYNQGRAPTRIYAIGDNPAADVLGANNAGPDWTSILVDTGVYGPHYSGVSLESSRPGQGHTPHHHVKNVQQALDKIFELEGVL